MSNPSDSIIIYLISGANRGIGLALVKAILGTQPNAFVYAGARDVEGAAALKELVAYYHNGGTILETPLHNVEDHFRINVYGPLVLFQATHSLLRKSSKPKFISISSQAGSIDGFTIRNTAVGNVAYGSSKAALNWVTRKIHFENEWLIAFPLSPGMVNTDMFQTFAAENPGASFGPIMHLAAQPDDAALAMLKIITDSNRTEFGGKFFNVDGKEADW